MPAQYTVDKVPLPPQLHGLYSDEEWARLLLPLHQADQRGRYGDLCVLFCCCCCSWTEHACALLREVWDTENERLAGVGLRWQLLSGPHFEPCLVHLASRRSYELSHPGVREVSLELPPYGELHTREQQAAADWIEQQQLNPFVFDNLVRHNARIASAAAAASASSPHADAAAIAIRGEGIPQSASAVAFSASAAASSIAFSASSPSSSSSHTLSGPRDETMDELTVDIVQAFPITHNTDHATAAVVAAGDT